VREAKVTKLRKPELRIARKIGVDLQQLENLLRPPSSVKPWPERWQVKFDGTRVEIEGNDSWATLPAAYAAVNRWLTRSRHKITKLHPGPDIRSQWISKHIEVVKLPPLQEAGRILEGCITKIDDRDLRLALRGAINAIGEVT